MSARFAAIEARTASAVVAHLSNADALLDGVAVQGIFDSAYLQAFDGVAGSSTGFTLASSLTGATTTASLLVVAGSTYRVRSVQPDGTGVSLLLLELQ